MTDLTHQGQIVAKYRRDNKWSRSKLAEALHVDVCTIYRMEKRSVIKDLKRRQLLVGLLGIPAILLGLDSEQEPQPSKRTINADRMAFFEYALTANWVIYRTGGTTQASQGLDLWLKELNSFSCESQGSIWQERVQTVLNMSYQLQGCILRDTLQYNKSHNAYKAEAYYGLGQIDASVSTAEEALVLARSVGSEKQIARVRNLHAAMMQSRWKKESHILRLGTLLSI